MGAQISRSEQKAYETYKRFWPQSRFLALQFLIPVGSLGFVGYAFTRGKSVSSSPTITLIHLVGVSGGFGLSLWTSLVQGRAIERVLSRNEYAVAQSYLSPIYSTSCSVLASLSLGTFLFRHPFRSWRRDVKTLGITLLVALVAAQLNSLILEPKSTDLLLDRNQIELLQSAKTPTDIKSLHENDISYHSISVKYDLINWLSILSDLVYHGVQWYHLFFLADRCLVL